MQCRRRKDEASNGDACRGPGLCGRHCRQTFVASFVHNLQVLHVVDRCWGRGVLATVVTVVPVPVAVSKRGEQGAGGGGGEQGALRPVKETDLTKDGRWMRGGGRGSGGWRGGLGGTWFGTGEGGKFGREGIFRKGWACRHLKQQQGEARSRGC